MDRNPSPDVADTSPREVSELFSEGVPDMDQVLLSLLAGGPATGWELARAIESAAPGLLERREGYLYPVLAQLVREARIVTAWREGADGRPIRLYAETADALGPPELDSPALSPAGIPLLERTAHDVSRSIPGSMERTSARSEIRDHLERSFREYLRMGAAPDRAAHAAASDLGDAWKMRTDLGRVHRGKSVIIFPSSIAERVLSAAIYDLGPLVLAFALVLFVRWQVVQAYNIPTTSMAPTLHGDEEDPDYIVVNKLAYLMSAPHRWDIIVFYPPLDAEVDEPTAFVKRCVGLGGETLDIRAGDIWIDGRLERRPLDVESAMMVPLYDLGEDLLAQAMWSDETELSELIYDWSWDTRSGDWTLRGDALYADPAGAGEAWAEFIDEDGITNRHYLPDGTIGGRSNEVVGDAEVRFELTAHSEDAVAGADLTEGHDRHILRLGPHGVTLRSGEHLWRSRAGRMIPGKSREVRVRNVDDRLTVWIDGEMIFREELPDRGLSPVTAEGAGVQLVATGGPVSFGRVRILRDVHYERIRKGSAWSPRVIPEGRLFMMGDNTKNSNDSRGWGPVSEDDLIGSPYVVLYPFQRFKILR